MVNQNKIFSGGPDDPMINEFVSLGGVQPTYTPDTFLDESLQSQLQSIQNRFNAQWKTIQQNAEYLGVEKANAMLQQLTLSGKTEVANLQQEFQQKRDMLQRIGRLQEQGAFDAQVGTFNVDKMKWEIAGGRELASTMFPKQPITKPIDPIAEYGRLEEFEKDTTANLERFHIQPAQEDTGSIFKPWTWGDDSQPAALKVWDPDAINRYKKNRKWVEEIGAWVDPPDTKAYKELASLQRQLNTIRDAKQRLRESPHMGNRLRKAASHLITGENPHGTLSDKISASVVLRNPQRQTAKQTRGKLDQETARSILERAGGNKDLARQMARKMGYEL